ncbi:gfo/Idh/MocA family oxidoreductase [Actinobacteria bacterium YIM 96077]|uniref:Gfo/Idh/MocA family oxidoreductase n=1 Tax=Phytoactinopolyspora halophila TaxID=1981511 RepID=A0A329R0A3_9ACTN|nr:Gfo/Idh/MocA family oxidoreductase [Phytoactinopolyspora halophila]AYY11496.1 gfo/Idh/MocA family oxidoreductase [Actinobacteria bacterium YIM 96077]RAW18021.1 gfo/Idh/MocA family oxidoreductase [Phytoactinopolyspora halophila]
METRTRYAVVGLGSRSTMFTRALLDAHRDSGQLVGLCDVNGTRMNHHNARFADEFGLDPVPCYDAADFIRMLDEQQVDAVVVASVDRTHDHYIVTAMDHGCDVITEKPLTTDETKCQRILDTRARTGRGLTVTFNYRYAPRNSAVKELLASGAIGDVQSVHFEWLLDTRHGADYFRRWHRDKRNSGGLMVHKSSHHFDLVNWWLDAVPRTVFGFGDLRFYGWDNAEARGQRGRGYRNLGRPDLSDDPWAIDLSGDPELRALYLDAEHEDGYVRDRDVFSDGISIEDDMAVLVRYDTGATLSYHLTAYSPWEGYRVGLNGTHGRVELQVVERSYVSGQVIDPNAAGADQPGNEPIDHTRLTVQPLWAPARTVPVEEEGGGGHGGGDRRLLADIFGRDTDPDPLGRAAGHVDGALAMLTGTAANRSFATGLPVQVSDLVTFPQSDRAALDESVRRRAV